MAIGEHDKPGRVSLFAKHAFMHYLVGSIQGYNGKAINTFHVHQVHWY
jgi:hypothetical protein